VDQSPLTALVQVIAVIGVPHCVSSDHFSAIDSISQYA
jgi:hypothetical protein